MDTRSWNRLVRKLTKVTPVNERKSRDPRPKEPKLVWTKAPPPFDQKRLRASIHAYVARQKKIKAEIMSGKFNVRFAVKAA